MALLVLAGRSVGDRNTILRQFVDGHFDTPMDQLPLPSGLLDVGGIRVADGVVVLETLNGRGVLALNALREVFLATRERLRLRHRSEEHTSELQSLMRSSYAVFCLKKKTQRRKRKTTQLDS